MAKAQQTIVEAQTVSIGAPINQDDWKHFFRLVTARQNNLSEIFPEPAFINLTDIDELHLAFEKKLSSYKLVRDDFSCTASFSKYKTRQSVSWAAFKRENWKIAETTESLTLRWDFVVLFPDRTKPCPFTVSVRCASALRPQDMIQFMLSRDEEEIDDMHFKAATMSCKVDFSDPLISQELLDIVARWNNARRRPEGTIPGLRWCCKRSDKVASAIRLVTPLLTFSALISFYYARSRLLDPVAFASTRFVALSLIWFSGCIIIFNISTFAARWVGSFAEKNLDAMLKFHVFEITSGDMNRQTKLAGESARSLWKFTISGVISILWNVAATYLCVRYLALS